VNVTGAGETLGIRDGWIEGNGTVDANLALGYDPSKNATQTSPAILPGINGTNNGIGVITVTKSFQIFSSTAITHIRVGQNAQCSKIVVRDGLAALNGNLVFELVGNGPPAAAVHMLVEVLSKANPTGQFVGRPEGSDVEIGGVEFKISYLGVNGKDNDTIIYPDDDVDGQVWHDRDMDGVQNDGPDQFAMPGFTVKLYDAGTNDLLAQTTTDENGNYRFDHLARGDYYLEFIPLDNWRITFQDRGPDDALDSDPDRNTRKTAPFTLGPGEDDATRDAGMYQLAAVGDYVWSDGVNAPNAQPDGIQYAGEPGWPGLWVALYDGAGNFVAGTVTDPAGRYEFRYLEPGTYEVRVTLPPPTPTGPYTFTVRYAGGDPTRDSNADASGSSGGFSLGEGEANWTIDFGVLSPIPYHDPGGGDGASAVTIGAYALTPAGPGGGGSGPVGPSGPGRRPAPAVVAGEAAAKSVRAAPAPASISVAPDFVTASDFVIDVGHPRLHHL
jgi:hypothetical protein